MASGARSGRYRSALITGASSGIGAALARALAQRGASLTLVARRVARLEALRDEISAAHGVRAEVVACDLSRLEPTRALAERLGTDPPDLLVNNAGFGLYGAFADLSLQEQLEMLDVNIRAMVQLTHAYTRAALARRRGALLQVASTAGFAPLPFEAVYAATKSFVIHWNEALSEELRGSGVRVLTVCPGFTETEFASRAGLPSHVALQHGVTPESVASAALAALEGNAPTFVHGFGMRVAAALGRVAPRRLSLRLVGAWMSPARGKKAAGRGSSSPPGPR